MSQQIEVKFRPFSNTSTPLSILLVGVEFKFVGDREYEYTGTILEVGGEHADPAWIGEQVIVIADITGHDASDERKPHSHMIAKAFRTSLLRESDYLEVEEK